MLNTLPPRLRMPLVTVVLITPVLFAVWASLPESYRAEALSWLFEKKIDAGRLFPSVEHEEANYVIRIDALGGADWDLDFKFRRLRDEAKILADMIATSGGPPEARSDTHQIKTTKYREDIKKQANLDRYLVTLDISNERLEDERRAHIRYHTPSGFSGRDTEWAGVLILQPTRKVVVNVIFQANKVGRDFRFSTYPWSASENPRAFVADRVSSAQETVTWEIHNPKLNQVYRVDWNW